MTDLPPYLVRVGTRVLPRSGPYYTVTMMAEDIAHREGVSIEIATLMAEGFDRAGAEMEFSLRGAVNSITGATT